MKSWWRMDTRGGKGMIKRIWESKAITVIITIIVVIMATIELD